jgi:hypothetical protein
MTQDPSKEEKPKNIKLHFAFTCLAYGFFGFGWAVMQFGIRAHLGFKTTMTIFIASDVIFVIMVFTSMEKVKAVLFANPHTHER